MQGEKSGDASGAPHRLRQAMPNKENQSAVQEVPADVFPVHGRGAQPEELAIYHVRDGGQRVPVGRVHGGCGPNQSRGPEALINHRSKLDVRVVVEVDESAGADVPIGGEGDQKQGRGGREARRQRPPSRSRGWVELRQWRERATKSICVWSGPHGFLVECK